ncbi:hypothetical protein EC973_004994 [Apophysomyces ossiformis]|uniref:Uncharacterized protein n=1 Tax=Apophysomyces ossiformis TaxID=679940 RepID=A0A8H7EM72_9FUNG|nr:hypothetical protein EC973_004994 [Apophysomyces ossiformis]
MRFVNRDYVDNREPTIGAAFLTQKCQVNDRSIKFEIWDTAGQERFHSLAPMYYRNAQAAIVAYDITKSVTLDKAKSWVKELQRQAQPEIVIALVGNKLDLVQGDLQSTDNENERQVPEEDAQAYAEEAGLLFFETSAKSNLNVEAVFNAIGEKIPLEHTHGRNTSAANRTMSQGKIDLAQQPPSGLNSTTSSCAC